MRKSKILNQAGDTIVEVLISVVVVGMAVGLGYGVASRSLKANRQSQERVEALKLVEGQVEQLRKRATTDDGTGGDTIFRDSTNGFCLGVVAGQANQIIDTPTPRPALSADPLGTPAYSASCIVNNLYHLSITPPSTSSSTKQFTITARWFGLGRSAKEESTITYRVYPQSSL